MSELPSAHLAPSNQVPTLWIGGPVMPDGVLHRHEDGRKHRHFSKGFEIGGQIVGDHDGTEAHSHGTISMVGDGGPSNESGPVVWTELMTEAEDSDQLVCLQCGADVWIEDNGVSHHWDSGNGDIDYDLDGDHTAIPDMEEV